MITQAISLLVAAISIQGEAATPAKTEAVKLQRVYKAGDADQYSLSAKLTEGGMEMSIAADMTIKVLAEAKDNSAEAELSCQKLNMEAGGADAGPGAPAAIKTKLNKNGMPAELEVKDEKWVYVLMCVSGYVPGAEVTAGKEFNIAWTSGGTSINGKGSVAEIVTENGKKIAVIKSKATVTPEGDEPGEIEVTSRVDVETGKLIKGEGKVVVGGHTNASFSIKKVVKSDK